eukprot:GDKI01035959.1.p1 GENE.GDKI01035959.1~~GDKI01035959.1.p1  ORF type:complete len:108 (+),score=19.66 GDKI01035959.1:103-426(+)
MSLPSERGSSKKAIAPSRQLKDSAPNGKGEESSTQLVGACLVGLAYLLFVASMYCLIISKFMPDTGNFVLDSIKRDWYYCLLIPCLVPTSFVFIYVNWVSMKYFRHA